MTGRPYVFSVACSAGFQTCCIADFQVCGRVPRPASLETRDTADLEVCATPYRYGRPGCAGRPLGFGPWSFFGPWRLELAVSRSPGVSQSHPLKTPRKRPALSILFLCGLICVLAESSRCADLPLARLHTIFPPGGKAGTSFEVSVTGLDLDDAGQIHFSNSGITATQKMSAANQPEANRFMVSIDQSVLPGVYDARVVGRFGISNPRGFAVGNQMETTETGNHTPGKAMAVAVGTSVNGRMAASSADYFKFEAKKEQRVLIECLANQLDSKLDPVLVLSTPTGSELERNRRGGLLDFITPADGTYVLKLHDLLYRGGDEYFYRLTVGGGPHIDFVFPPSLVAGGKAEHTLFGRNLPGGESLPGLKIEGKPLQRVVVSIDASPQEAASRLDTSAFIRPSEALLDGFDYRLRTPEGSSSPKLLTVATAPVITEQEPNNQPKEAQKIQVPCELVGQFFPANDVDCVTFDAKKGDAYWIELFSQRLGFPTDPFALVQRISKNDQGDEQAVDIQELYDSDANIGGVEFNTTTRDPVWRFEAKEDGTYRVQVRDLFNRNQPNPALVYRLSIRKDAPDFRLVAVPQAPPSFERDKREAQLWSPFLRRGDSIPIKVFAFRRDNFGGDIELTAENLPTGITANSSRIAAGQNSGFLVLHATDKAGDWFGPWRIVGKANTGSNTIVREARGAGVVWNVPDYNNEVITTRMTRSLVLASAAEESPFVIEPGELKTWETSLAAKLQIPLKMSRHADFKGKVKLRAVGAGLSEPLKEWEEDGQATASVLDLDLAKVKVPAGLHQILVLAQTSGKYRKLRPNELKTAEAIAKTAEDNKQQAEKAESEAKEAEKKAAEALVAANKALEEAEKLAKASDTNNPEAKTKVQVATEAKAAAQKAAEEATARSKTAEQHKEAAIKVAKEAAAKIQAREVTAIFYSPPVNLQVATAPITLATQAPTNSWLAGAKLEIPVTITRLYGFTDGVELSAKDAGGIKVGKITIPKDQTAARLVAEAAADAKPGTQKLTLQASLKFNGQDLKLEQSLTLRLAESSKQEN